MARPPGLAVLLSGLPADELVEFREILRRRSISEEAVARILQELDDDERLDDAHAPVERLGRRFTEKRQRLRKRLAKILSETIAFYKREMRPAGLHTQPGYQAACGLQAALENIHDSIVGPAMAYRPKPTRGPRRRSARVVAKRQLKYIGLGEDLCIFAIRGLILTRKKE